MVEQHGNRWCVVHGHPRKKGSKTDKPKGTIIKCYRFTPGDPASEKAAKAKALAMHHAILISQQERKK